MLYHSPVTAPLPSFSLILTLSRALSHSLTHSLRCSTLSSRSVGTPRIYPSNGLSPCVCRHLLTDAPLPVPLFDDYVRAARRGTSQPHHNPYAKIVSRAGDDAPAPSTRRSSLPRSGQPTTSSYASAVGSRLDSASLSPSASSRHLSGRYDRSLVTGSPHFSPARGGGGGAEHSSPPRGETIGSVTTGGSSLAAFTSASGSGSGSPSRPGAGSAGFSASSLQAWQAREVGLDDGGNSD